MTIHEAPHNSPDDPIVIEEFGYVDNRVQSLAVIDITPSLARSVAPNILNVRTAVLDGLDVPGDVRAKYYPSDEEVAKQVAYIANASAGTHYVTAVTGPQDVISKLMEKDEFGIPNYAIAQPHPIEIAEDLPEDVREYIEREYKAQKREKISLEASTATVGLAKIVRQESDVRICAIDVIPDHQRQGIGSLLVYKTLVRYEHENLGRELKLRAQPSPFDAQAPYMLEAIGMQANSEGEYVASMHEVQQRLFESLTRRDLLPDRTCDI